MRSSVLSRSFLLFTFLLAGSNLLPSHSLLAQSTASLVGTVKDTSGGAVAGAQVTVVDQKTTTQQTGLTDTSGNYSFQGLAAGKHIVKVLLPGFRPFESKPLEFTVGNASGLAIVLEPSASNSSVDVSAQADPFQIVPEAPTTSVFGFDKPLVEISRSISVVPSEMMTRYSIRTVNDLVTASPGSFTGSYFGVPGSLFIRGEAGDNFYRGFRRVENRGNYSTPVEDAEELEIVKGPPSPIYGGGKVGGYLNYIPKTARSTTAKWLEHPTGKITLTYGSYDQKIGSVEFGSPFKIGGYRGGIYSYFSAQDSKSFYKGISTRAKTGQIAFDMELPHKWRIEAGMQGFAGALPQNIGWNRVTQDLIDHGTYLAGSPIINLAGNDYNLNPKNFSAAQLLNFAFDANYASIFLSSPQAKYFALNPATVHNVHLNNNQIFIDTPDFSDAITYTGYLDEIRELKSGLTFKNQTFYDSLNHQKFSTYGFAANYTPNVIENKTTLDYTLKPSKWLKAQVIGGFAYRYSSVNAGEERTLYQVIDRRDISAGAQPNDRFASVFSTNGQWGYNYYQHGNFGDAGLFVLGDFTLFNKLTILQGLRYDYYTPDFLGRDNGESLTRAKSGDGATTYNTSVSYKLPYHITPYFTTSTSRFLDLGQGGELDYSQIRNHTYIQPSNLYEEGVKASAFENKLFVAASYFRQKHSSFNSQSGAIDYFRTKGFEGEVRAAVNRRFSVTGAYTWQNPEQLNIPFLLGIPPSVLGLTPQQAYGGRFIGNAGIFGIKAPVKVAGQPPVVMSVFATYTPKDGFGVTFGTTWVDKVKAGYITPVILPSYNVLRGSVFYNYKNYAMTLAANNIGNSNYFTSQYLFWDVFVKPSELRTVSLTLSYRF
jgi:iron complex outermembrane receptor protein